MEAAHTLKNRRHEQNLELLNESSGSNALCFGLERIKRKTYSHQGEWGVRRTLKYKTTAFPCLVLAALVMLLALSTVSAARCQISNVTYAYPQVAQPNQQISIGTSIAGSCASDGESYYAVRVDLVDLSSGVIVSSSDTPIGYNAQSFNVTTSNPATTPSTNGTWPLQVHVYVIRAGGTNGMYLLDYETVGNATIQVGSMPVPEFHLSWGLTVLTTLMATSLVLQKRRNSKPH